ncbi:DJ-1/PfpI family protein [Nocardia bovistercoris]|uniref:DJ-1/PfpI family protein n=1 Tax=Nocardia bovistercoris TaxID=2785916 RepID=A0A931IA75_9NOCA|nr:DJ-1/PfpI family protein [Nocardia bovistercoris]MBH0777822.1 DJ-1/PfpI family protein [Nocardia bovistercoris]
MQIAFALYDRFTALDIIGPFQVLAEIPGVTATFVAEKPGPVRDHTGALSLVATASFDETTAPRMIVVPGGLVDPNGADDPVVRWIRAVHPTTTWTASVCTGSIYLARAGVLDGIEATSHWGSLEQLASLGAVPSAERVVIRGRIATAAGVSAGIDLGLTLAARLAGADVAKAIQLAIEYDPQPPFDAGSPAKAGPEIMELVMSTLHDPAHAE